MKAAGEDASIVEKGLGRGLDEEHVPPSEVIPSCTHRSDESSETSSSPIVPVALGWLDRLLALWILLAMVIGVVLGNFVEDIQAVLQRGKFVGVSLPIGEFLGTEASASINLPHPKKLTHECKLGSRFTDVV